MVFLHVMQIEKCGFPNNENKYKSRLPLLERLRFNPQTTLWGLCRPRNILTRAQEVNIGISEAATLDSP